MNTYIFIFRHFISLSLLFFSYNYAIGIDINGLSNFLLLLLFWFFSNQLTHRFYKDYMDGFLNFINPNIKGLSIFIFSVMILIISQNSSFVVLDFFAIYLSLEIFSLMLFFLISKYFLYQEYILKDTKAGISFEKLSSDVKINIDENFELKNLDQCERFFFTDNPQQHLGSKLPISYLDGQKKNNHLREILIKKDLVNDTKDIDFSLKEMYDNLKAGGLIITFYNKLETRYSGRIKYFDYFFHAFLPTLPFFKNFYKITSGSKNRILSTSEMGRLHRTGFEVEKEIRIKDSFMLISKKVTNQCNTLSPLQPLYNFGQS